MIGDNFGYKYISSDVPNEKIDYSYSEYRGEDFIYSYKTSREYIIEKNTKYSCPKSVDSKTNSSTELQLIFWINCLVNNHDVNFKKINLLLKRFEVTKKIFNEYDKNYRPIDKTTFKEFRLYILFSYTLVLTYKKTKNMQYLNSLLKVNDINISIYKNLTKIDIELLKYCLQKELNFVTHLKAKLS